MGDRYDQTVVSAVERGRSFLAEDGLLNAARELGVSLDWLFGLTDDPAPPSSRTPIASDRERLGGFGVSAGPGSDSLEGSSDDRTRAGRDLLRSLLINLDDWDVQLVSGDSMEPTLQDGFLVLVDPNQLEMRDGCIYLMRTPGGLVVKRLVWNGGWFVVSDNPRWPPSLMTDEISLVGEVKLSLRVFG